MMVVCEKRECLVGVNKTFGDHFAGIGNMVIMKSQFVTSPKIKGAVPKVWGSPFYFMGS